jgi:hydrogenase expression/formation protein HypE
MSDRILMGHGSGGRQYRDLVERVFVPAFANPVLDRLDDAALLELTGGAVSLGGASASGGASPEGETPRRVSAKGASSRPRCLRIALTTDSHVVQPLRFPGGDIGRLAVAGTVNDLATAGARPLALAAAFIIEEGFPIVELEAICASMASAALEAGVPVVTGDTKVVYRGLADGLYITTTGVGEVIVDHEVSARAVRPGDAVLLSGGIGEHSVAVLAARGDFDLTVDVRSDCAPLWSLVEAALAAGGEEVHFVRDPTRGGLATVLAELAETSGAGIDIEEERIPVTPPVRAVCELLGYDPLMLANEGKMVLVVGQQRANDVLVALRAHPLGARAERIGSVTADHPRRVALRTPLGTRRVLDMPVGELLPRIC